MLSRLHFFLSVFTQFLFLCVCISSKYYGCHENSWIQLYPRSSDGHPGRRWGGCRSKTCRPRTYQLRIWGWCLVDRRQPGFQHSPGRSRISSHQSRHWTWANSSNPTIGLYLGIGVVDVQTPSMKEICNSVFNLRLKRVHSKSRLIINK